MTDRPPLLPVLSGEDLSSANVSVRSGSPFAAGSAAPGPVLDRWSRLPNTDPELIGEGVYRETATAAAFAACMLLAFAVVGYAWYPAGGIAITLLGIAMGVMGLSSRRLKLSVIASLLHVAILSGCYFKLM